MIRPTNLSTKNNFESIKKKILKHIDVALVLNSKYISSLVCYLDNKLLSINKKTIKKPVVAVSGVADNSSVKKTFSKHCSCIKKHFVFGDHHNYSKIDIENIINKMISVGANSIVTTRKDFVKIASFFPKIKVYVVDVKHVLENEIVLENYIKSVLK